MVKADVENFFELWIRISVRSSSIFVRMKLELSEFGCIVPAQIRSVILKLLAMSNETKLAPS